MKVNVKKIAGIALVTATFLVGTLLAQRHVMDEKIVPGFGNEGPFSPDAEPASVEPAGADPFSNLGTAGTLYISKVSFEGGGEARNSFLNTKSYLNVFLTGDEWHAIFFDVLGCPQQATGTVATDGNSREKYKLSFQEAIPDYPMLGRLYDIFNYSSYNPEEVEQLRDELLRVQAITPNEHALKGIRKMIIACDEVRDGGGGLLFEPE